MKVLDREKVKTEAKQANINVNERFLEIWENILPLMLAAYEQGKNGEPFDVWPIKEIWGVVIMAYINDNGVLTNTPEDNLKVEQFFAKQKKIGIRDSETGEIYAILPYVIETNKWYRKDGHYE